MSYMEQLLKGDLRTRYMMLARFKSDCDYFLGNGKGDTNCLWNKDVSGHIANMKALYESFRENEKPDWLTMEDIEAYERKMSKPVLNGALILHAGGIKCDNPECDFADLSVGLEDYEEYLNRPCPKCGTNLLTQADYDNVKRIIEAASHVNHCYQGVQLPEGSACAVSFHMDGTGKLDINIEGEVLS